MDAQLKRGILEICVLAALNGDDSYGYQIIKDVSGVLDISESTLYPILKRLEAGGCVQSYTAEHNGRLRRYYRILPAGRARIGEFLEEWKQINTVYAFIEEGYRHGQN